MADSKGRLQADWRVEFAAFDAERGFEQDARKLRVALPAWLAFHLVYSKAKVRNSRPLLKAFSGHVLTVLPLGLPAFAAKKRSFFQF